MIERYTLPEMGKIWTEENKFKKWLQIEILVAEAQAKLREIPQKAVEVIKKRAKFDLRRILEIESKVKHDVIAFLTCVTENVGEEGRFLHLGLTSSDILDTSLALRMKEASEIIISGLKNLRRALKKKAKKYKKTIMIGRSHGIHAEPITFGLKMALMYSEMSRNLERVKRAKETISYGKISGAVGTFANVNPFVEEYVCKKLNLKPAPISTQILQRDRHAEFLTTLAIVASSLEKFATEIRNLQHTEILEVEEPFTKGQKGSSAMPHKRNPIVCERVAGLARLIRGNALTSLQNITLWHERDISHSSVERIIIPDGTILVDYMLQKFTNVIENLSVYPENMKRNLEKTQGLIFSERILLELVKKGISREEAYELAQKNALRVWEEKGDFKKVILKDKNIRKYLSEKEIKECFDLGYYLKNIDKIFSKLKIER